METKTFLSGIFLIISIGLPWWGCDEKKDKNINCLNGVILSWNPNTEPDLGGYKIYYGTKSRKYETPIDVGNSTVYTLSGLEKGIKYFGGEIKNNTTRRRIK
jgi:hypothetical protein